MARTYGTLVLACPAMEQQISQDFMLSLLRLIFHCNTHGIPVTLDMISHDPIVARARNTLAARCLDRTEASHILFLSPDTQFSVRQVIFMLTRDLDVLAGPVAPPPALWRASWDSDATCNPPLTLSGDVPPAPAAPAPDQPRQPELKEVNEASLGFMLIHRDVLTKLTVAYPELYYRKGLGDAAPASPNLHALFDSRIDPETREYLSGDAAFCRLWKNIGGKIWQTNAQI